MLCFFFLAGSVVYDQGRGGDAGLLSYLNQTTSSIILTPK